MNHSSSSSKLRESLAASPFNSYTYAYPHKTAYQNFTPEIPLVEAWRGEIQTSLFLYVHVPFCEMRCGFCNLFTLAKPQTQLADDFCEALKRQAQAYVQAIPQASYSRFAIGGGTPTFLSAKQLRELLETAQNLMGIPINSIPSSVETSPATATEDRLAVLRDFGVSRISIGVQSFTEAELRATARPQQATDVHNALLRMRGAGFPVINLDLIYGLPEQTVSSWLASVRSALRYTPEELFLYPLYVRPLTGLGKSPREWNDYRLECYREARVLLLDAGYHQVSMRLFRASHAPEENGPAYCVQDDGMIGLGCGARSYTRGLHYADRYAVGQREIATIIRSYTERTITDFTTIGRGFELSEDEQKRRYVLLGLLQDCGVDLNAYHARFKTQPGEDLPGLLELEQSELIRSEGGHLKLTPAGMELSDAIGPYFYSPQVRKRMEQFLWQ
jgi:oxygen-independent coproporphyrinogen III oxidase